MRGKTLKVGGYNKIEAEGKVRPFKIQNSNKRIPLAPLREE
jgi:hypothetical protein